MKKIVFGGLVSAMFVLGGCATPSFNAMPDIKQISKPSLNVVTIAGVGDEMLTQGVMVFDDGLTIKSPEKISGYTILQGKYQKVGQNEKGMYFSTVSTSGVPITKAFYADPYKVIMVSKDNELCVVTVFNAKGCKKDADFSVSKVASSSKDSFQQTLIYSGKVGSKINVGYREFNNDIARPAFSNNVEYDLSESKEIGYKGALLEIIDATNQIIKYKVLKNFNKADQ